MLRRAACIIILSLFAIVHAYAQAGVPSNVSNATRSKGSSSTGFDTTAHKQYPLDIKYTTIGNTDVPVNIDTTLNNIFLHRAVEDCFTCLDLGNTGLPSFNTSFNMPSDILQRNGITAFNKDAFSLDSLRFYTVKRPYSDLYFTQGSKNELQLTGTLAERIMEGWFAGINMHFARSNGFYSRQGDKIINLSAYTQYTSKNQHFSLRIGGISNSVRTPINGGVQNDSVFYDTQITQKDLEPVNLDTAYNRIRHYAGVWQTSYDLGPVRIDSSHKQKHYIIDRKLRVQNTFTYEKYRYYFYDDTTDKKYYYVPFNTPVVFDSITQYNFKDELGIYVNPKGAHYQTYVTAGINYNRIFQPYGHNVYHQYFITGHQEGDLVHHLFYSLTGKIATEQSTTGSYLFTGELIYHAHTAGIYGKDSTKQHTARWLYGVSFSQAATPPTFTQLNYYGSLYDWHNGFANTLYTQGNVFFRNRYVNLTLSYNHLNDYIYYGLDALPHQFGGGIDILQASLKNRFKLWRHFYNANELMVQNISNTNIISMPAFVMRSQLYFESDAFKKASHVQLGVMARYWSDYYAPEYMPATMQFYLQQGTLMHYRPVFDVFTSMRIKSARLFLRFDNVTNYIIKGGNFSALHYPMPDPAITFGINWILWN